MSDLASSVKYQLRLQYIEKVGSLADLKDLLLQFFLEIENKQRVLADLFHEEYLTEEDIGRRVRGYEMFVEGLDRQQTLQAYRDLFEKEAQLFQSFNQKIGGL